MQFLRSALLLTLTMAAFPQVPARFDVASIRPSGDTQCPGGFPTCSTTAAPGTFGMKGAVLKLLVMLAYEVQETQMVGGPDWFEKARWDVTAKVDNFDKELTRSNTFPALRALLEERFKLKVHRETREVPIYELVQAKGGSKLASIKTEGRDNAAYGGPRSGNFTGHQAPLSRLTELLSPSLGRPIVDRTGLIGVFDFKVDFDPASVQDAGLPGIRPPEQAPNTESNLPTLFKAFEEQLGLRLVSSKGPAEMLVIDSAEMPTEN